MSHPYGESIRLHGVATSNLNTGGTAPYVGTCYVCIKPPGSATYTRHAVTTGTDGAWEYYIHSSEPRYASGTWTYRVEIDSTNDGATADLQFVVGPSFVQTTPEAP